MPTKNGRYRLHLYRKNGGWRWNLMTNGRVVAASTEAYVRREAAVANITKCARALSQLSVSRIENLRTTRGRSFEARL